MICPECSSNNHFVSDSRSKRALNSIRRRRRCRVCGHRWFTIEMVNFRQGDDLATALRKVIEEHGIDAGPAAKGP